MRIAFHAVRATLTFSFGFIHDQFHSYTVERKKIYSVVGLERERYSSSFFVPSQCIFEQRRLLATDREINADHIRSEWHEFM